MRKSAGEKVFPRIAQLIVEKISAKICGREKVFPRITQLIVEKKSAKICGRECFLLIVQMEAEEGSDKICENLREKKVFPQITQITAEMNKIKSAKICGRKYNPADLADGRRNAIQMILKNFTVGKNLWGKIIFSFFKCEKCLEHYSFLLFFYQMKE